MNTHRLDDFFADLQALFLKQRFARGVLIILSCILFYFIIDTFKSWHTDWILISNQAPPKSTSSFFSDEASARIIASLPNQHLFGLHDTENAYLPITSLQIRLTGIVQMPDGAISRAIISEGGKPGKVYKVGDEVLSGIKIYSISPNEIVLERGGQLEKLPLMRTPLLFQDSPKSLWQ